MNKWDLRFLKLAREVSTWSKDPSTQTGAVITRGKHIISVGYNGFPAGMPDGPDIYANREEKYSRIVHCEVNALVSAKQDLTGCTLYTWPFLSCDRCVVQMLQSGIRTFFSPQCPAEQAPRWEPAFQKTRKYITECGGHYEEIPLSEIV